MAPPPSDTQDVRDRILTAEEEAAVDWTLGITGGSRSAQRVVQPNPNVIEMVTTGDTAPRALHDPVLVETMPGELFPGQAAGGDDPDDTPDTRAARVIEALTRIQEKVLADNDRIIDVAAARDLGRRFRPQRLRGSTDERKSSHQELMNAITAEVEMQWFLAQGIDAERVKAIRKTAFLSGMANPTGTLFSNTLTYMIGPLAGALGGSPWFSVLVGGVATAFSPLVNSAQQSGVVTLCEHIREGDYSIVSDKASLNDAEWPKELAEELERKTAEFTALGNTIPAKIQGLLGGAPMTMEQIAAAEPDQLQALLASASAEEQAQVADSIKAWFDSMDEVEQLQLRLFRAQGSHARQQVGNTYQIGPRAVRGAVSGVVGFGRAAESIGRANIYSSLASVGIQSLASGFLHFLQMLAAGWDETNKQDYNDKLNLLYGAWMDENGDVDEDKLRSYILSPEQALVKRMTGIATSKRKALEKELETLKAEAPKASDDVAAEQGHPYASADDWDTIRASEDVIRELKEDEQRLKNFDLVGLQGSITLALFEGTLDTFKLGYKWADLQKKYATRGELSSQTAQRIGQVFHGIVFGSAGSALVGRITGAGLGGASQETSGEIGGLAALSAFFGVVGAFYQSGAIKFKNLRRGILDKIATAKKAADEDPGNQQLQDAYREAQRLEMSLMAQVKKGVFAGVHVWQADGEANTANQQVDTALTALRTTTDAALKIEAALAALSHNLTTAIPIMSASA